MKGHNGKWKCNYQAIMLAKSSSYIFRIVKCATNGGSMLAEYLKGQNTRYLLKCQEKGIHLFAFSFLSCVHLV